VTSATGRRRVSTSDRLDGLRGRLGRLHIARAINANIPTSKKTKVIHSSGYRAAAYGELQDFVNGGVEAE
jgi:hypothetical protein